MLGIHAANVKRQGASSSESKGIVAKTPQFVRDFCDHPDSPSINATPVSELLATTGSGFRVNATVFP